jgi:predicted Zn finger-like uncharacterized protein
MIITCPNCATRYQIDGAAFPEEGRRVKCAQCAHRWHAVAEPDLPQLTPDFEASSAPPTPSSAAIDANHGEMQAASAATAQIPSQEEASGLGPAAEPQLEPAAGRPPLPEVPDITTGGEGIDDIEAGARFVSSGDEEFEAMAAEYSSEFKERRARGAARGRPVRPDGWQRRMKKSRRGKASAGERAQAIAVGAMLCGLALMAFNRESVVQAAPQMASLFTVAGLPVNARGIAFAEVRADFGAENGIPVMRISGRMHNIADQTRRLGPIRLALIDETGREVYHWTTDAGQSALEEGQSLPFQSILTSPPTGARSVHVRFAETG